MFGQCCVECYFKRCWFTLHRPLTSEAGGGTAVPAVVGLLEIGLGALSAPGTTSPNSFINDRYYRIQQSANNGIT